MVQSANLKDVGFLQDRWENHGYKITFCSLIGTYFWGEMRFSSFSKENVVFDDLNKRYDVLIEVFCLPLWATKNVCLSVRSRRFFYDGFRKGKFQFDKRVSPSVRPLVDRSVSPSVVRSSRFFFCARKCDYNGPLNKKEPTLLHFDLDHSHFILTFSIS